MSGQVDGCQLITALCPSLLCPQLAEKYKETGNEFFKEHHYPQAIEWVRQAPQLLSREIAVGVSATRSNQQSHPVLETNNLVFRCNTLLQYTKAIETDPTKPAYWANRAYAYERSEKFGAAVEDAEAAIKLDRNFLKAYVSSLSPVASAPTSSCLCVCVCVCVFLLLFIISCT